MEITMLFRFALVLCLFVGALHAEEKLDILFTQEMIHARIDEVAQELNAKYAVNKAQNDPVVLIMVMKSALCTACDLMRKVNFPLQIEYVKASSYGLLGTKPGELTIKGLENVDIANRDVLLVDDTYDSGNTLTKLTLALQEKNPKSLNSLVLISKNLVRTCDKLPPDYVLFHIEDLFVVGYGLDYKEKYRELPGVFVLTP